MARVEKISENNSGMTKLEWVVLMSVEGVIVAPFELVPHQLN